MRRILPLTVAALLLCSFAVGGLWADAGESAAPDAGHAGGLWCADCHKEGMPSEAFAASPHAGKVDCRFCHLGLLKGHLRPEGLHGDLKEAERKKIYGELRDARICLPDAVASCNFCHNKPPHGLKIEAGYAGKVESPHQRLACAACHGHSHAVKKVGEMPRRVPTPELRLQENRMCADCHGEPYRMAAAGKDDLPVQTYAHSVHGRKLLLKHKDAPGCLDCHWDLKTHEVKPADVGVCQKCHDDANEAFVPLAGHAPLTPEDLPVSYYTVKFFALLTFLTIMALAGHVLIDLFAHLRRMARKQPAHPLPAPEGNVQRFDIHQRLQHGLMAVSFILLVLTGWPLTTAGLGPSRWLADLFGGIEGCAHMHRLAAVGLILSGIHHLLWIAMRLFQGKLKFSMMPMPKDFMDLFHNLAYYFGLRKDRPRFPRYSYFEKFDYWAVFWGMFIMVGSGLIRWFPDLSVTVIPAWAYEIAHWAHTDEALLAALAIFVWHFYNVHLRPDIFPMSRVFLTGKLTLEELKNEHGAEYEDLEKEGGLPKNGN